MIEGEKDLHIAEKMLKIPPLKEKPKYWDFTLANEFHMTHHSYLFENASHPNNWPLYEGRTVDQFANHPDKLRYWINSEKGREILIRQEMHRVEKAIDSLARLQDRINGSSTRQKRIADFLQNLGCAPLSPSDIHIAPDTPRLVFRSISSAKNVRTMITTVLPPGIFTNNALNYLIPWRFNVEELFDHPSSVGKCYELMMSPITLAYLCGVLNSFILDYMLRFKVSISVNMLYIYQLPVPRLEQDDPRCLAIANRVARLVCVGDEYGELRKTLLGDINEYTATDRVEREHIQAEIEGLVAHLYRLSIDDFEHILGTFPLVDPKMKESALDAYYEFSREPDNLRVAELIAKGESSGRVEFKVAAYWDEFNRQKNDSMKNNIIEEVAAFSNTDGGTILIGIRDDGTVAGLVDDYIAVNPSKPGRDTYKLFLLDVLKNGLDANCTIHYEISFANAQGKDVCRIDIDRAEDVVYLKNGNFYVREGNRKRKLITPVEIIKYGRSRWT